MVVAAPPPTKLHRPHRVRWVAEQLDVSRRTVHRMLRAGWFPGAMRFLGVWTIPHEAYLAARRRLEAGSYPPQR